MAYLIFKEYSIHDTRVFVRQLPDVAAKEDGLAGFDHLDEGVKLVMCLMVLEMVRRTLTTASLRFCISVFTSAIRDQLRYEEI